MNNTQSLSNPLLSIIGVNLDRKVNLKGLNIINNSVEWIQTLQNQPSKSAVLKNDRKWQEIVELANDLNDPNLETTLMDDCRSAVKNSLEDYSLKLNDLTVPPVSFETGNFFLDFKDDEYDPPYVNLIDIFLYNQIIKVIEEQSKTFDNMDGKVFIRMIFRNLLNSLDSLSQEFFNFLLSSKIGLSDIASNNELVFINDEWVSDNT
ncbi:TPA: hypothetical protein ACGIK9_003262 [Acinetobacter baumannii]|uniref:hypothetical protein n=1 Tax=Acinetobacter baumannii TaxID=470 RepID=UPI0033904EB8